MLFQSMQQKKPSQLTFLYTITYSRMKAQEFLLLIMQKKPALRQGFTDSEFVYIRELCDALAIKYTQSDFYVDIADTSCTFSNKGLRISQEKKTKTSLRMYYFSFDPQIVELLKLAEEKNAHNFVGQLLGYPPCCIEYFTKHFSKDNTNLEFPIAIWELTITQRHRDYCILSHFPCSKNCISSLELARQYFDTIFADNELWAKELRSELQNAILSNSSK
jgi:hypothetical protein